MLTKINNVRVKAMAAAVSNNWESLKDISQENEKVINKFIKKIGIEGRYAAMERQTTSDFCYAAANRILIEKKVDRSEIGVLIFVTQTPDYIKPATACVLQKRLGLNKECIAFDINLGCSGFTSGLAVAGSLLDTSKTRYALLLAGDTSAKEKSKNRRIKTNHVDSLLFGDSGTATLLEKSDSSADSLIVSCNTDGTGFKYIISPYEGWRHPDRPSWQQNKYSDMDDIAVFSFSTEEASKQIIEYMKMTGTTPDSYDCLVLHQANLMIIKRIAKKTGFSEAKNLISINRFANTSSASIPVSLVNAFGENHDYGEIKALCCGYGVGLSWSTVALEIEVDDILPLVHTDEYFDDGYPDQ